MALDYKKLYDELHEEKDNEPDTIAMEQSDVNEIWNEVNDEYLKLIDSFRDKDERREEGFIWNRSYDARGIKDLLDDFNTLNASIEITGEIKKPQRQVIQPSIQPLSIDTDIQDALALFESGDNLSVKWTDHALSRFDERIKEIEDIAKLRRFFESSVVQDVKNRRAQGGNKIRVRSENGIVYKIAYAYEISNKGNHLIVIKTLFPGRSDFDKKI